MNLLDSLTVWVAAHPDEPTQIVLTWDEKRHKWAGAMHHGREADDSPMWGGASYSIADTPHEALSQIMQEFRVPLEHQDG